MQLPGMRKLWDQRFESGHMLARYDRTSFAFYTVMKGMGWLVYPRDIVGIQRNYHPEDGSEKGERMIIQTSIEEPEWAPEQKGKTRATLTVSGWRFTCVGPLWDEGTELIGTSRSQAGRRRPQGHARPRSPLRHVASVR